LNRKLYGRSKQVTHNKFTLQDMQCTYKVTLSCVRPSIVAAEKRCVYHNLSVYICSLTNLSCNALAPYCHLFPAPLNKSFPLFLIKGTIF